MRIKMHLYLFLLLSTVYITIAVPVKKSPDHSPYSRFIKFPNAAGELEDVDLEAEPDYTLLEEVQRNPANSRYYLYTRRNPTASQLLILNDANSVRNSHFDNRLHTVVISHGWLGSAGRGSTFDISTAIKNAYLGKSDVNVIVIDWSRLAWSDYVTAVFGVPAVGRGLGEFVRFLVNTSGLSLGNLHLVGFSLGGHLVGIAGRQLGGGVARITALDPAGPLWNLNSEKIRANDGRYVEAIHTDGGYTIGGAGIGTDVADVDFYPNGGISQPGCLTSICNHNRAWELFAATVTYNHLIGQHCSSSWQVTWESCSGGALALGNDALSKNGRGKYRVNTSRSYPY